MRMEKRGWQNADEKLPITSSRNEHRKVKIWPLYLNLCTPDLSNRTKPNKKPIELQSFDWVRQSNTYFAVSSIFEPIEPIQSTKIEQNRTNPMQLSLDASNWVKHGEYNHDCQLLLNNQEPNIILQECQCSNKTKQIKGNFDDHINSKITFLVTFYTACNFNTCSVLPLLRVWHFRHFSPGFQCSAKAA